MVDTPLYLAIDVGTGSVRVAIFTPAGQKLSYASQDIITRNPRTDHYEQSTQDVWSAIKTSIKSTTSSLPVPHKPENIAALGVDATCSLVACADRSFSPVSISFDEEPENLVYDIILWLDRRGVEEASFINNHEHPAVKQVRSHFGGKISPENEPPKLLWLKKHKPQVIRNCVFFDLADWVTFKCTGDLSVRSACTVSCKWGWGSDRSLNGAWSKSFWETLELNALCEDEFRKIGTRIVKPGQSIGPLADDVSQELHLSNDCIVASPMIDAHAGALWTLGLATPEVRKVAPSIEHRLSVIAGTSTCFIQLSKDLLFVHGVWGPFRDAVLAGYHVTEGGQSITGKLLENTVRRHPSYHNLVKRVGEQNVYDVLTEMTEAIIRNGGRDPAEDLHCLDYHAGNRSPLADPSLKGCMVGLTLEDGEMDLAITFRATMQALCCGARRIVETMVAAGHDIRLVTVCGGLCKSMFFVTELADCVGLPIAVSSEEDTVLLGGAILGRACHSMVTSDEDHVDYLTTAAVDMTTLSEVILPKENRREYYSRKYAVYRKLYDDFQSYRQIMKGIIEDNSG